MNKIHKNNGCNRSFDGNIADIHETSIATLLLFSGLEFISTISPSDILTTPSVTTETPAFRPLIIFTKPFKLEFAYLL